MTTLIDFMQQTLDTLAALDPTPVPDPGTGEAPPGVGEKVLTILKWIAYLATTACVGGILYAGGRMALAHRRGDDANLSQLGWVLAGCVVIGSASGIVGALI